MIVFFLLLLLWRDDCSSGMKEHAGHSYVHNLLQAASNRDRGLFIGTLPTSINALFINYLYIIKIRNVGPWFAVTFSASWGSPMITWTCFLMAVAVGAVAGADCNTKANITGPPNFHPVDTTAPYFLARVPNGELYMAGTPGNDFTYLLHVYGTNGYDFGYAAGRLLKKEMTALLSSAWTYFEDKIIRVINGTANKYNIPPSIVKMIAEIGLEAVLDLQNDESERFVDPEIYAEMRGIADAAGLDYKMIRRIHLIGEITRAEGK